MNWQQILAKMENHINKLTPRRLSLYGKPILLNILILTKTAYLGNVFPIPNLWKGKTNTLEFTKTWKNTYYCYSQPHATDLLLKLKIFITLDQIINTSKTTTESKQ